MKINCFTIKGVTTFTGHEGESCLQGSIYMDNKRIGTFSDDTYSGGVNIDIKKEFEEIALERARKWFKEHPFGLDEKYNIHSSRYDLLKLYGEDDMMTPMINELENLFYIEKFGKKYKKQGYPLIALVRKTKRHTTEMYACTNAAIENLKKENEVVHILTLEDLDVA